MARLQDQVDKLNNELESSKTDRENAKNILVEYHALKADNGMEKH